jgi:arsenite/tail-anchored protein-transporting ATPase
MPNDSLHVPLNVPQRLVLVTGKGGTGKTTLAAAIALRSAKAGRRVLLVEADPHGVVARVFNSPVSFEPAQIAPNLWASNIDFINALKGYVIQTVKLRRVVDAILDNEIVRRFLDATPSSHELTTLMQIQAFCEATTSSFGLGSRPKYDQIIVDLAASGHALMLLRTPKVATDLFKAGPIFDRASELMALLTDHAHTTVAIAALPEDLSVSESIETAAKLRNEIGVAIGPVFANMVPTTRFDADELTAFESLAKAAGEGPGVARLLALSRHTHERATVAQQYIEALRAAFGPQVVELPLLRAEAARPLTLIHRLVGVLDHPHALNHGAQP